MAYKYEKQHREVHASLQATWRHLFQMMWEALLDGRIDQAREYRNTLEDTFRNADNDACELFLKLQEAEQSKVA